jgi:DNA-binding PadR family transcriptional regulator
MPADTKRVRTPGSFLPLHPTTFYILASLVEGPKHGYAISKDIEERSDGETRIAIGNLYVALKRLLDDGLIEREPSDTGEERRKVYRITGLGSRVVHLEIDRIEGLARTARGLRGALQGA